ncbi:MAG TPA: YbaK/EbsC family protein [bacterium]|nr:YbaK/EbsC family protein [bacterium]
MSIPIKVKKYLDKQDIDYQEIVHKTVYTAFDAAQTLKKELNQIAKNLLVQVDKTYVLVVVPADKKINLVKVKRAFGAKKISIPNEKLMIKVLKIKPGALSSFGKLHQLETLVDKAMLKTRQAVFSTGSFTDSVFMKVKDFIQVEEAKLADVAMAGDYKIPKSTKKKMRRVKAKVARKKSGLAKQTKPAVKKKSVKRSRSKIAAAKRK